MLVRAILFPRLITMNGVKDPKSVRKPWPRSTRLQTPFLDLAEKESLRATDGPIPKLAGNVSPIGDLLSHTAKSKSRQAYERVVDILREIDFECHMDED